MRRRPSGRRRGHHLDPRGPGPVEVFASGLPRGRVSGPESERRRRGFLSAPVLPAPLDSEGPAPLSEAVEEGARGEGGGDLDVAPLEDEPVASGVE